MNDQNLLILSNSHLKQPFDFSFNHNLKFRIELIYLPDKVDLVSKRIHREHQNIYNFQLKSFLFLIRLIIFLFFLKFQN